MKIVRTYPNLLWLILNFVFLIFFGILIFIFISVLFNFKTYFIINDPNRFWAVFPLIFATFIFVYFYYQLSNHFTFARLNTNDISFYQVMKFKFVNIRLKDIKGYSNSEISYGRIPLNYTTKSIVIYIKDGDQFELIKLFNYNFDNFTKELKDNKIKYLGKEQYQSGIYKRKYKYIN
jgi:hypothetical protein